ncbi:MAG: hypothetical protein IPP50_16325 [Piscinibacter sp.]|nr:hypothetical protein [Piscinibacter sp.]
MPGSEAGRLGGLVCRQRKPEAAIRSIKHEVEAFNAEQPGAAYVLSDIALHGDRVPDHYIVGEETAPLEALEGRTAMPRKRPPFPIESGLFGVPTLVHKVETVAHVPYIVLFGGDHHRTLGDAGKGMTLCTLGDEFVNAGVHLVPLGIPVRELLYGIGKGLRSGERIVAVQPGGPSSGFLTEQDFECSFDHVALAAAGSALGCAAVRAYGEGTDMVRVMVEVASFFEEGSCGQCPQCRMETRMLAAILRHRGRRGARSCCSRSQGHRRQCQRNLRPDQDARRACVDGATQVPGGIPQVVRNERRKSARQQDFG